MSASAILTPVLGVGGFTLFADRLATELAFRDSNGVISPLSLLSNGELRLPVFLSGATALPAQEFAQDADTLVHVLFL